MNCYMCGKKLTGDLDTFGDQGLEVCQNCFFRNSEAPDVYYGLAPHTHKYDKDGLIIIGSTEFDQLPKPNENGDIIINGYYFYPDPEAPGCGVYSKQ